MGKKEDNRELISEVTTFIQDAERADSAERELMISDLRFVYDENGQWDKATLNKRKEGSRPSYTFNHVQGAVNQVLGEQRMNRTSIKIRGVDDKADPELAEVFAGMIRNIESMSDAEAIYDMAFKYAVAGGFGAWRIVSEHKNDYSFDQEIFIKPIYNPMTVFFDPLSFDPVKRDQKACVVAERISKEQYKSSYGDQPTDVLVLRDNKGWVNDTGVRIAEYFKLIPVTKEIALMSDGRVIELTPEIKKIQDELANTEGAASVERTRKVETFKCKWWKVDGANVLEGPIEYDWKYIPIVKLPGRFVNIEGDQKTQSLIRVARDPQKVYNYDRTTMSEVVANAPRAPYLLTANQIKGYEKQWNSAGAKNAPYLMYNSDPKVGGAPQRAAQAEVPAALMSMAAADLDDIKSATGFYDASLGRQGNEVSGVAIAGRSKMSDVGSYEFHDNLKRAIKFTGEILVDMIPKVYDTERTVRILGLDGSEDFTTINTYDEATDKNNDLSQGRYDVVADIGPTYSTQREESFANLLEAAQVVPGVAEIAGDLIMKNLDVPGSDEIVKRMRASLIARGVVEPNEDEMEELQAKGEPPPDPVAEALVASETTKAQANIARAEKDSASADKVRAETAEILEQLPVKTNQLKSDLISSTIKAIKD